MGEGHHATAFLHLSCYETGGQLPSQLPRALLSTEAQLPCTKVGKLPELAPGFTLYHEGWASQGGSVHLVGEGLLGDTEEGTAGLQPQETQVVQRRGKSLMLTTCPQAQSGAHLNPGLTLLQTWPPPAPRCGPDSCWQL